MISEINLSNRIVTVYRQHLQDCSVYPVLAAVQFDRVARSLIPWVPSARFLFYHLSLVKRTVETNLKLALKTLKKFGVPGEVAWPSEPIPMKQYLAKPPQEVYDFALTNRYAFKSVKRSLKAIHATLTAGSPIMFTFDVPSDFGSNEQIAKTGFFHWTKINPPIARHAGLITGLIPMLGNEFQALILNSFGPKWGIDGYFTMPLHYLLSRHCRDFFTLTEAK